LQLLPILLEGIICILDKKIKIYQSLKILLS
jgi:hypothetical protein